MNRKRPTFFNSLLQIVSQKTFAFVSIPLHIELIPKPHPYATFVTSSSSSSIKFVVEKKWSLMVPKLDACAPSFRVNLHELTGLIYRRNLRVHKM